MFFKSLLATTALLATSSNMALALFECNADQHAFPSTEDTFVVHYTSIRDSDLNQPWIRICKPDGAGGFVDVEPLVATCGDDWVSFSTSETGLDAEFWVENGAGCDSGESDLDGAHLWYDNQDRDLNNDSDFNCGDRDHGISCVFSF